jgi:hypothetical protein
VVHGIHAGHDGKEHLRRTYVAGRLVSAYVLLSGLQCHPERRPAIPVFRNTDDASGQRAFVRISRGKERRVRAAIAHRHAEPLAVADSDVGSPFARRREQREAEKVRRRCYQGTGRMGTLGQLSEVSYLAVGSGVLHEDPDDSRAEIERGWLGHDNLDAACMRTGTYYLDRLGMTPRIHQVHRVALHCAGRKAHVHRFGGGGCLVQQRCVGHLQPREVGHHGLKVQESFQPPLRYLRLVWRVGGVPSRVFQYVPLNDLGGEAPCVSHADVRAEHPVHAREPAEGLQHLPFTPPWR